MATGKRITIFSGPNGSARAQQIDARLLSSEGRARLLVPSVGQAQERRERYFAATESSPGVWGAPIRSLTDFAQALVVREGVVVTRFDSSFQQRLLMEHCLQEIAVDLPETSLVRIRQTPGLIRHLVSVINDLKQAAIEPDIFAERLANVTQQASLDEGVAAVYALYQESMQEAGLYDVPGLYWHADYIATQGRPKILEGVTTLLWDGFDDFTPSEFRLLRSLSEHVDSVYIGLNLDSEPDRQDRYTLTANTLRELRQHFDCQVVTCEAPALQSHVDFAVRHIFWREEPALPDDLAANLTILPCSDTVHEVESIGRRIKGLIVESGVAPDQIAVVYMNLSRVADALRSTFGAMGIPCQISTTHTLASTGLGTTLLALLSGADNWARETVLDLLHSPWLQGHLGNTIPQAAAYYVRKAGILDGFRNWNYLLGHLLRQLERGSSRDALGVLHRHPNAVREVQGLLAAVALVEALQQCLPTKGTQYDFALAINSLIDDLQLDMHIASGTLTATTLELEAVQGLRTLLELLADTPGSDMVPMDREDFLTRFEQGMGETTLQEKGTPGGVRCMDAAQIRNQRFSVVFFAGLTEGQVPAPPVGNAVYPERDRERLQAAEIPIEGNQAHHARQRMLFGHVLECAAQSMILSWPLTQDDGRESSPSPFLTDVRELFPVSLAVVAPYPKADSFLPDSLGVASTRELVNRALFDSRELAEAFPDDCATALTGADVESQRQGYDAFGLYDGVVSDPALVTEIARHYGATHEFSVNQLETYIGCPFNFYVQRILHLEESAAPDGTVDARDRGTLLHEVLQRFHRQFLGLHVRDIGLGKAESSMETLVDEVFDGYDWSASSAPRGAIAGERANLKMRLLRYLRMEHAKEEEQHWKPRHFEVAFGQGAQVDESSPSVAAAYALETADGVVHFTGRIDRIDTAEEGTRIIDYKSGATPPSGEITSGKSLQLSVYAKAVEELLLPGAPCTEAHYLPVGKDKSQEALGIGNSRAAWPYREANMMKAIEGAVSGIRSGYFPPLRSGNSCYGCGNARACRYDAGRVARKTGEREHGEE